MQFNCKLYKWNVERSIIKKRKTSARTKQNHVSPNGKQNSFIVLFYFFFFCSSRYIRDLNVKLKCFPYVRCAMCMLHIMQLVYRNKSEKGYCEAAAFRIFFSFFFYNSPLRAFLLSFHIYFFPFVYFGQNPFHIFVCFEIFFYIQYALLMFISYSFFFYNKTINFSTSGSTLPFASLLFIYIYSVALGCYIFLLLCFLFLSLS